MLDVIEVVVWGLGIGSLVLYAHHLRRSNLDDELPRFADAPAPAEPALLHAGRPVHEERLAVDTSSGAPRYVARLTISGALPPRLSLHWPPSPPALSGVDVYPPARLWATLLFGKDAEVLLRGTRVTVGEGDLVLTSDEVGDLAVAVLRGLLVCLDTQDLEGRLYAQFDGVAEAWGAITSDASRAIAPEELRATAAEELLRVFPDSARSPALLERLAADPDVTLRAIAAAAQPGRGRATSIAIADDPRSPKGARVRAIRALLRTRDDAAIVGLTTHPVPPAVAEEVLDVLARTADRRHEPIVRGYLTTSARARALDVLAVLGTRETLAALVELARTADLDADEERRRVHALDRIRSHLLETGGAARGALALSADAPGRGAVSVAQAEQGAVSLASERGALSHASSGADEEGR
ncbi:hypothetical protein L6R52_18665 [Myxococcota bacterium]|nr:hypothetical protein [Myxococcota bacterium]